MTLFDTYVEHVEHALMAFVETGSDHELFLSSYLHGHVDVIIAEHYLDKVFDACSVDTQLKKSLSTAFSAKELDSADQSSVLMLWNELHSKAQQVAQAG